MAYCTYTDVQSEFKNLVLGSTHALTSTEVTEFIEQASNYIDARIGLKYETPVTATAAISVLKMIAIWMVKKRILRILAVKGATKPEEQEGSTDLNPEQMLSDILSDKLLLVGADLATTGSGVRSYTYDNDIDPVFEKGTDQW